VDPRDLHAARYEAFAAGRPAGEPGWLAARRKDAMSAFSAQGFPTTRDEDWRYTSVATIARTPFEPGVPGPKALRREHVEAAALPVYACSLFVFVNGRFAPELSAKPAQAGEVAVRSLAVALAESPAGLEPLLARRAPVEGAPFVALNTAFLEDGAVVLIPPRAVVDGAIQIVSLNGGEGKSMAHPRTLIVMGSGSEAKIAQTFLGVAGEAHFTNPVTEVVVGDGAVLDLYIDQRETDLAYHVASVYARIERSATFRTRTITLGGKLLRNDTIALLDGEGAHATLDGVYLVDGDRLLDNHTTIDHASPNCTSHELYKGILDGKARAIFNGRIIVRLDAQKTDSKQTNRALLLSDEAQINSNPQLEIFADDVKCTHGAAIGQLDEEALFYLRARGLTPKDARDMLIHAYAGEVLEGIGIEHLKNQLLRELFMQLDRDLADHEQ